MSSPKALKDASHEAPFRLESIERAASPEGSDGVWYRYVIVQGKNQITGVRSGGESEVTHLVNGMVERLNERRSGKTRPKTRSTQAAPSTSTSTSTST